MLSCPVQERPREKAIKYGIDCLSNQELLAVILRTGHKKMSVLEVAQQLLNEIGGFTYLKDVDYYQLTKIKGIKSAKAIEVLACIELAKRMQNYHEDKYVIKEPQDGYNLVKNRFLFESQEKVILLCLNNQLEVIKEKLLFVGSAQASLISSQEIFKEAICCGAHRIMLVHNHPSGNPQPSQEDKEITEHLMKMAYELDMELIDHIIVGNHCFYSFASKQIYTCKVD